MIKTVWHKCLLQAAFFLSCFLFVGCENDQQTLDEWSREVAIVEEANDIQIFLSQGSRMRAKLWAPKMFRYQADTVYVEFPRTLHVDFFDSTGAVESHLDARYGKYFESLNKVYLRDSVVVFNVMGDTLHTPELWWDQSTQKFFTSKPVRVRKSGHLIFGLGMEARQDLTNVNVKSVNGSLQVPDSVAAGF